jgi:putative AlgH/UPF0301 family transcriptional regulator
MAEVTSKDVAAKAAAIMQIARHGGPIQQQRDSILKHIHEGRDNDLVERLDTLLRPYIDAAESVAASALTQREKQ